MADTEFNAAETAFLRDLATNKIWSDILEKLGAFGRDVPAYKPNETSVEKQEADWKYYSGFDTGKNYVLKRLSHGK